MDLPDLGSLPPELQAHLRTKLLELLRELGVQPRFHRETGEMLVPLEEMCAALGLSLEEAEAVLGDEPGCTMNASLNDTVPLQ